MSSKTWTPSDLDAAASENAVVHENTPDTDYSSDSILREGLPIASPIASGNIAALWPMHDDTGTGVVDKSGNNNDGTGNGVTFNQTGILGTSAIGGDGTDDYVDFGNPTAISAATFGSSFACGFVCYPRTYGTQLLAFIVHGSSNGNDNFQVVSRGGGNIELYLDTQDASERADYNTAPSTETWHTIVVDYDGTRGILEVDGTEVINNSNWGGDLTSTNESWTTHARDSSNWHLDTKMAFVHLWDTNLSSSQRQEFHDVLGANGSLITAGK